MCQEDINVLQDNKKEKGAWSVIKAKSRRKKEYKISQEPDLG